ncbi:zinc finger matrin-type protein 5 [Musca vetustissima]|uniref:zinc finger matrin-type protein 5 n=1 Tax=Musca vetustissima TaxID=27455 RepID=UPI002AB63CCF|nr:zinc finger matrin-type protein 5 [Musca vetustissima]
MGGKRYFCDYCQCYITNDVNVRKTHNDAVSHKINKIRYLRKFDDPRKIYKEEIRKTPCYHFLKGRCRYDLYCQSSHYTPKQLEELKLLADNLEKKEKPPYTATTNVSEGTSQQLLMHVLPWAKNTLQNKKFLKKKNLPPSLKPIKLKKLSTILNHSISWG